MEVDKNVRFLHLEAATHLLQSHVELLTKVLQDPPNLLVLATLRHQEWHRHHLLEDREQHLVNDRKSLDCGFKAGRVAFLHLHHKLLDEGAVLSVRKISVLELSHLKLFLLHQLTPDHIPVIFLFVLQLQRQSHQTEVEGFHQGRLTCELPNGPLGREQVALEEGRHLQRRVVERDCLLGGDSELLQRFDLLEDRLGGDALAHGWNRIYKQSKRMIRVDRETLFKFLRRITKELNHKFADLKGDFERSPPPPHDIKKRFMDWRSKYDTVVITTLKELLEVDEKTFSFKDFMVKATEENGTDPEFLDLLKGVNGAIETLKDFIRTNLIRDPTIYEIRD